MDTKDNHVIANFCKAHKFCDECPAFMLADSLSKACYIRHNYYRGYDPRTIELIVERMKKRTELESRYARHL